MNKECLFCAKEILPARGRSPFTPYCKECSQMMNYRFYKKRESIRFVMKEGQVVPEIYTKKTNKKAPSP